jgi:hypothetical protein
MINKISKFKSHKNNFEDSINSGTGRNLIQHKKSTYRENITLACGAY